MLEKGELEGKEQMLTVVDRRVLRVDSVPGSHFE